MLTLSSERRLPSLSAGFLCGQPAVIEAASSAGTMRSPQEARPVSTNAISEPEHEDDAANEGVRPVAHSLRYGGGNPPYPTRDTSSSRLRLTTKGFYYELQLTEIDPETVTPPSYRSTSNTIKNNKKRKASFLEFKTFHVIVERYATTLYR